MNTDENAARWSGDNAPTPINPPNVLMSKDSQVIHILGAFQELSASLGLARSFLQNDLPELDRILVEIQRHLYIIKCDFASASEEEVIAGKRIPRAKEEIIAALDRNKLFLEDLLGIKPDRFILEGGHPAGAALFLANEVARRGERLIEGLKHSPGPDSPALDSKMNIGQRYLNHLSWQLYLMARIVNRKLYSSEEAIITDPESGEVTVNVEPLDG